MAKDKTSSDKIKEIFAKHAMGAERDWKRVSKSKDAQGQPLRVFKNNYTGAEVTVIEKADGTFEFQQPQTKADTSAVKTVTETPAPAPAPTAPVAEKPVMPAHLPPLKHFAQTLVREVGGVEDDWKLVKVAENYNSQNIVVFANETIQQAVAMLELGAGRYAIKNFQTASTQFEVRGHRKWQDQVITAEEAEAERIESKRLSDAYEVRQKKEKEEKARLDIEILSAPIFDKDLARNALADKIIEKVLVCDFDVEEADIKAAGKALANRFCFGIGLDEGYNGGYSLYVSIAPLANECYDQHLSSYVEHLLPDGLDEASEARFAFEGHRKPMVLAEELIRRGFVVSDHLQEYADSEMKWPLYDRLIKLQQKIHAEGNPPQNKAKPSGPKM